MDTRELLDLLERLRPHLVTALVTFVNIVASAHAVLYKRDPRAAVGWVGLIWLSPLLGALLYYTFGINRIRRRAAALMGERSSVAGTASPEPPGGSGEVGATSATAVPSLPERLSHFGLLARFVERVVGTGLTGGNSVRALENGDEAYPAMLEAIDRASTSVTFCTYIFDNDSSGKTFVGALARAVRRGVEVRVLLDDVGARYSFPSSVERPLRRAGVTTARFLPARIPFSVPRLNLRNHRKILVVDGRTGFTGGMNIRKDNLLRKNPRWPVRDLHFLLEGPSVIQLQQVIAEDWAFTTGEVLEGERWFPPQEPRGPVLARGIAEGPDEDFEKIQWTILGALDSAQSRVRIVTPYFLPDPTLITALNLVSLSGVQVEILLPSKNNLPFIQWATASLLWQLLQHGCRVFLTPPPFDHSKLMVVDDGWALVGSTNWDPRSLRLNFEFNVECYDEELAQHLNRLIDFKLAGAHEVSLEEMDGRSLPVKLRDGITRLFSPYL